MTAGVNLLPGEVAAGRAGRRRAALSVLGVLAFVFALGGLYVHKVDLVNQAEVARDDSAAEVAQLQARVAELQEYRELADYLDARNAVLADAMADEVSFARSLNDVALAFPASGSMSSLQLNLVEAREPGEGEITFGMPVAEMDFGGYSVERYAPGVETVLIEFDRVSPLFNVYLSSAADEERSDTEITNFQGKAQFDESARTDRYADGLPAEVAP